MKAWLEKSSSVGALGAYEYQLFIAAQALVVIAVVGHPLAYRKRRNPWLLAGAAASGAAVFAGLYLFPWEPLVYTGFTGLVAASATGFRSR